LVSNLLGEESFVDTQIAEVQRNYHPLPK